MLPSTPTKRKKDYRYLVYSYFLLLSSHSLDLVFRHIEYYSDCLGSLAASHVVYPSIIVIPGT